MTRTELYSKALEELKTNDNLFVACINELDNWNGFCACGGFRAYNMEEINDLFYDTKVSDFLDMLTPTFNHNDNYFIDTIYGLDSTNDIAGHYRDNVDEAELLDNLLDNLSNIDIDYVDSDFAGLLEQINEKEE